MSSGSSPAPGRTPTSPARGRTGGVIAAGALLGLTVSGLAPLGATGAPEVAPAAPTPPTAEEDTELRLWYDSPAADSDAGWLTQSLPLGNGAIGVNVFGGVARERLQITENSVQDSDAASIGGLSNFAEVYLDFPHQNPTGYSRDLVLDDATAGVEYVSGGVTYTREYFTSNPDKVLAMRLTASEPGALDFTLRPTIPYLTENRGTAGDRRGKSGTVTAEGDTITLAGTMEFYDVEYEGRFRVIPEGGTLETDPAGRIAVEDADSAVVLVAVDTNYQMVPQVFSEPDPRRKLDGLPGPSAAVEETLDAASARSYEELRERHLADYTDLFDRAQFDLGAAQPSVPTTRLLADARSGRIDPYLEQLVFQFGRYLLISSSRDGELPPNLQGLWNVYQDPPFRAGYWHNINLQMNYWPAFSTGLGELFESYVDFNAAYLPRQQQYATQYIEQYNPENLDPDGDNGWSMGNSMWPYTGGGKISHTGFGSGGWTAQMFWDYYDYTGDTELLADVVYPVLRGQSEFLSRFVTETEDGLLLASPSQSPENTDGEAVGTTFDQQMIYENHANTLSAAEILGLPDDELLTRLREQLPKLDPIGIGTSGQLKEFREEEAYGELGDPAHRHVSNLLGLQPGQLVNTTDSPAWVDAAAVTLTERGRAGGRGWSQAERTAKWARIGDTEKAYSYLSYWISRHAMDNLWNNHNDSQTSRLFQVDANFGVTAGISEMLLQTQGEVVQPLAGLPAAWPEGSYSGLVARGAFEVSATWAQGRAEELRVDSPRGGPLTLEYPGLADADIRTADGDAVEVETLSADRVRLDTAEGDAFVVTGLPAVPEVPAPTDLAVDTDAIDAVKLTWTGSEDAASYDVYRAVGSEPQYTRVAEGLTRGAYVDRDAVDDQEQATYKVTARGDSGRESRGPTTTRVRPETLSPRILTVQEDLFSYDAGDGEQELTEVLGGDYRVGYRWAGGNLQEVTLESRVDGEATLSNTAFTLPVRVVDGSGAPVDAEIEDGTVRIPTAAGTTYRVVPQVTIAVTGPDGPANPGDSLEVELTVSAGEQADLPPLTARIAAPQGWPAQPRSQEVPTVPAGGSESVTFTYAVPSDVEPDDYRGTVTVSAQEGWSLSAPFTTSVERANLALGRPAAQSSTNGSAVAARAVDGNTNGRWSGGSVTHTREDAASMVNPWWQVDLGASEEIDSVLVWNRTDSCCINRLSDFYVLVSDQPFGNATLAELLAREDVWSVRRQEVPNPSDTIEVDGEGRYVRVQMNTTTVPLALAEVQVVGAGDPVESDREAPVTTLVPDPAEPDGQEGWYVSDPAFALEADDGDGFGVDTTQYRLDGGPWRTYTEPVDLAGEDDGTIEVSYRSRDVAENLEEVQEHTFTVDRVTPSTTATTEDDGGDVVLTLETEDATSGVARTEVRVDDGEWAEYTEPLRLDAAGSVVVQFRSRDVAGNVEDTQELTVGEDALDITATVTPRCLAGTVYLYTSVRNDDDVLVDVDVDSGFGTKSVDDVRPGRSVSAAFPTRRSSVPAGAVEVSAVGADGEGTFATEVTYPATSCQ